MRKVFALIFAKIAIYAAKSKKIGRLGLSGPRIYDILRALRSWRYCQRASRAVHIAAREILSNDQEEIKRLLETGICRYSRRNHESFRFREIDYKRTVSRLQKFGAKTADPSATTQFIIVHVAAIRSSGKYIRAPN